MVNDCIICDTEAKALAAGKRNFGCSISGQPLCADHWREIREEYAS